MSATTNPDLTIPLHDVGSTLDTPNATPRLRQGLIFFTPSIEKASNNDKNFLREKLGITTIIDTRSPQRLRYYKDPDGSYKSETCTVEDVLGVTLCHLHLRLGRTYAENLLQEMPVWERCKFTFKASMSTNQNDPNLVGQAKRLVLARGRVEDGLAALEASARVVGYVFNTVLAAPGAFPVLLCGDGTVGGSDCELLLFLILVLLKAEQAMVERLVVELEQARSVEDVSHGGQPHQSEKTREGHWTKELKQRLESRFGSVSGYLRFAGVTETTTQSVSKKLWATQVLEKEGMLVDISTTETQ